MRLKSLAIGLGIASLALALPLAAKTARTAPAKEARNACATCKERRAVLDPQLFADAKIYEPDVAPAYEAARKYPATLDRIHCFCECEESPKFKHKTLLTCFTDEHAASCGICVKEALWAADLKRKGASDEEVERFVESNFKTDGHPPTHDTGR